MAARVESWREVASRLHFRPSPQMVRPFDRSTFGHGLGTLSPSIPCKSVEGRAASRTPRMLQREPARAHATPLARRRLVALSAMAFRVSAV